MYSMFTKTFPKISPGNFSEICGNSQKGEV